MTAALDRLAAWWLRRLGFLINREGAPTCPEYELMRKQYNVSVKQDLISQIPLVFFVVVMLLFAFCMAADMIYVADPRYKSWIFERTARDE